MKTPTKTPKRPFRSVFRIASLTFFTALSSATPADISALLSQPILETGAPLAEVRAYTARRVPSSRCRISSR